MTQSDFQSAGSNLINLAELAQYPTKYKGRNSLICERHCYLLHRCAGYFPHRLPDIEFTFPSVARSGLEEMANLWFVSNGS